MIILNILVILSVCLSASAWAENQPSDWPYAGSAPTAPEPSGILMTKKLDAKSCHFDDVSAVAANAAPGTQVNIPAGTCDWGLHSLKVGAGVYIKGAGKNQTVIVRNPLVDVAAAAKRGPGQFLIVFNCVPGKPNSLSHLALQGSGKNGEMDNGSDARDNGVFFNGWKYVNGVRSSSPCDDFRVFNAKFSGFGFSAITVSGNPAATRGVIFNIDFINNYAYHAQNKGVVLGYGVNIMGDGSWPTLALGTADNIFIENNYMIGNRHHVASNNSSRYVFRHNTAITTASTRNHFAIDAHGRSDFKNPVTGSRQYEIYANYLGAELPAADLARTAFGIRGGDGVIFNNSVSAQFRYGAELMVENPDNGPPCKDMPDRIRDLYIWDNKLSVRDAENNGVYSTCPQVVKLNRDYFLTRKSGYTPYTYPHPLRK